MICRLIALLVLLSATRLNAGVTDYYGPTDTAGRPNVDLYDSSGNQRGTSGNPMYFGRTWSLTSTNDSITTTTTQLPTSIGSKAAASSLGVAIATDQLSGTMATSALQTSGNTLLQTIANNTSSALTDVTQSGTITAANGTVVLPAQGVYTASISVTGSWVGTIVFEGQLADSTWVILPAYMQTASLPYSVTFSATANGTYLISGGGYLNMRVRASAYTSGTIAVAFDGSLAQQTNLIPPGGSTSALQSSGNTTLSAISAQLPTTLGAKTTANALAVTVATDQTIPVASTPTDGSKATYDVASTNLVVVTTTPTDAWCITGSATKTIRVLRIAISGSQSTAGQRDVLLIRHSTANSGGTSTSVPLVSHDSNNAAATATVQAYTANPTIGTVVGTIRNQKLYFAVATGDSDNWYWEFGTRPGQGEVLRGTGQQICVNFNSVAGAGNQVNINAELTEE